MPKKTNPYIYEHDAKGKHCFGYRRRYKNRQLRARGFLSSGEAEQHLNQAMADVDAVHRGGFAASQPPRRMLLTSTVASSK
jgi:hypothetical protein